jgi:ubiquinol-cytochrome c reductase cytochrome c1 subunit
MLTKLAAADGEAWFGKAPPDLSLISRSKGSDYVYRFLKTYYLDDKTTNGTNNLALPGTAMPHVLSALQGAQVLKTAKKDGQDTFEAFEIVEPGQLTPEQYDEFLRDTVNFLEYAGEPVKAKRESLGVWVMLFLLLFTSLAWLLKREYWRDVK